MSEYEGYIGDVQVAWAFKDDHVGEDKWCWGIEVQTAGESSGWVRTLRDAKAEVEKRLAGWQPPTP